MPHFILHCSANILQIKPEEEILQIVHDTAFASGLFMETDIKVRIQGYTNFTVGGAKKDFIHVFAYIMEGRITAQKADLSRRIVTKLKSVFPDAPVLSMNVMEFERDTYFNRDMV